VGVEEEGGSVRAYIPPSGRDDWGTPDQLYMELAREFRGFDLDPAASEERHLAPAYYTPEDDGLSREWFGRVWCNPPYGRDLGRWITKARDEVLQGHADLVVMLLPARTDVRWFHDLVAVPAVSGGPSEVRFLRGRLRFHGASAVAPFPSMVVVWRGPPKNRQRNTS
jgi:site-specific DNA-methyltransferase (adenine-specific)